MYNYDLSQGNPEGIDYCISLQHEKDFTAEEFQDICEAAIVETLGKMNKNRHVSLCNVDTSILLSVMEEKGFTGLSSHQSYHLEPYWGKDAIKNQELLDWAKK